MKAAIIGTGNLGKSIARGLLKDATLRRLYLTRRKTDSLKEFATDSRVTITTDNFAAITDSEVVIFAVQPSQMTGVLQALVPHLKREHLIISTVTGFEIEKIEAIVGSDKCVIRAMPNTAISVGQSMTCISVNGNANGKTGLVLEIFNRMGRTMEIPESQMQAATVICASGIAFWMRLIRATTQGAIQLGFEAKEAQELAMQTCYGAASLLIQSGNHPEAEIDKVTTPQGCTIQGLNEMEHQGLSSSLIRGITASFEKINQIRPL